MSIIIALGALFFYHLYISDKLATIRYEIDVLKGLRSVSVIPPPDAVFTTIDTSANNAAADSYHSPSSFVPHLQRQSTPLYPESSTYTPEPSAFALWLKQDILVKVGALLLLIALGWFVSYAFANNWIGPVGRITLGILTGLGIMVLGVVRIAVAPHQGGIFTVLGSTAIILTLFAARGIYGFFTPDTALGLMFMTVAFVAFVSVRYRREQLAIASLVLGAVAPLLTNVPALDVTDLSLYLLMLVAGTLWVVYLTRSSVLTPLALAIVALYGVPFLALPVSGDTLIALFFAFVFTSLFFVTNVLSILSKRNEILAGKTWHYLTAIGTGIYIFAWVAVAAPVVWQTPLYLIWMLVFAVGAFAVYSITNNRLPFYIYGSVALGLLAAATANEFEGAMLTIVYTIQLLTIILVADSLVMNSAVARKLAWLFVPLSIFALQHVISPAWQTGVIHTDFFATVIVTVALVIVGIKLLFGGADDEKTKTIALALLIVGGAYVLTLIWLVFHGVMADGPATTFSLVTYTILGLIFYVSGRKDSNKSLTTVGILLIVGVVGRLLLIDVWNLQLEQRIIVFFVIGVLLLSTAFIKKSTNV